MITDYIYGLRYLPKVDVIKAPVDVDEIPIEGTSRLCYTASIVLRLQSKDKELSSDLDIRLSKLVVTQGRGRRKRRVYFRLDTDKDKTDIVRLPPNTSRDVRIYFKGYGDTQYPNTVIETESKFRWEIYNIEMKVLGLSKQKILLGNKQ